MKSRLLFFPMILLAGCSLTSPDHQPVKNHNLSFESLPTVWDEALPLGNGELGALIWSRDGHLRFSLDRVDLWDLRPISWLQGDEFRFSWVYEQWLNDNYGIVQDYFDRGAYSNSIAPSKIPGAALEFYFNEMQDVIEARVDLFTATTHVAWKNGARLESFVSADQARGWFRFTELPDEPTIRLIPPVYKKEGASEWTDEVTGQELTLLGYEQGKVEESPGMLTYHQVGWGGFYYDVAVKYKRVGDELVGTWSITSSVSDPGGSRNAAVIANEGFYRKDRKSHLEWWQNFWSKSFIKIPDSILERQWYLEQYKFGSAARAHTPPISLQAVWTADNGKMPPWKGDFHHDLNTQLSYWPAYSANHLDLEEGFLNWLWQIKPVAKAYTRNCFETEGLNVPGVTTLNGEPMGGWIQYSCGPTVSAWLGQHFYLHWRYSMDRDFLANRAYPWISEVATFIQDFSVFREDGMKKLPLSSSPEIFDNSRKAWFSETTNFDLALIRFTFEKAAELATELGKEDDALRWRDELARWPGFSTDSSGFHFAPGVPYEQSHRHFSHLMAWHPLGLVDWFKGDADREIILNTLSTLEKFGPAWWVGYSYSWQGNLYARAMMGDEAAAALRDFATAFCLPNSFHVNGDQTRSGKSNFTYRPFTLEGNFAFAAGVQEMLIQSHTGVIRLFPAIPADWTDVKFDSFRTEGAFIVSAEMKGGRVLAFSVTAEKGGLMKVLIPGPDGTIVGKELAAGETFEWTAPR